MTVRTYVLICIGLFLSLGGCLAPKEERPPPMVTPENAWIQRQAKVDASLSPYRGEDKLIQPCVGDFLETLRSAQKDSLSLTSDLEKQAQYRGYKSEDGYVGAALQFYRKVTSTLNGLTKLESTATQYCINDASQVSTCFDQQDPVRVVLDQGSNGEGLGVNEMSETSMLAGIPKQELQTALACLQSANLKTDLGQSLTRSLKAVCDL